MRQTYLFIAFITIILTSCASTPHEAPKGKYLYFPIDDFFQGETEEEVNKIYRKSFLECENEKMKIQIPTLSTSQGSGKSRDDYRAEYASRAAQMIAIKDRGKYFDNCLELKGFEKKWVPQTFIDEEVKEFNKTKNYD